MSNSTPTDNKSTTDCSEFVSDNQELLARVLARGDTDAQGYALALKQKGGSVGDIDQIQDLLEELKAEKRE